MLHQYQRSSWRPSSLNYLAFVVLIANEYEWFLLPFQSQEPMIYLLCHGISRLLTNMLKNFVSKRVLYHEDGVTMKPATQLKLINLNKESNLKSLNLIGVGTKAKSLLSASILDETVFRKNCLKFYISAATQLQIKLPFDNKVILHAQYLHPKKWKEAHSTSAISNLSSKMFQH